MGRNAYGRLVFLGKSIRGADHLLGKCTRDTNNYFGISTLTTNNESRCTSSLLLCYGQAWSGVIQTSMSLTYEPSSEPQVYVTVFWICYLLKYFVIVRQLAIDLKVFNPKLKTCPNTQAKIPRGPPSALNPTTPAPKLQTPTPNPKPNTPDSESYPKTQPKTQNSKPRTQNETLELEKYMDAEDTSALFKYRGTSLIRNCPAP